MSRFHLNRKDNRTIIYLFIIIVIFIAPITFNIFSLNQNINIIKNDGDSLLKTNTENINIITPENTTYTAPMSGYYPATYGFENGEIWNILNGFNITEDEGCTLSIIPSLDGHKNVVELSDSNSTGRVALLCSNYYTPAGTIEFWMRTDDVIQRSANFIYVNEAQQRRFMLKIENSKFQWSGGPYGVWHDVGLAATANRWYHFRIVFDFVADFWELWIDGIKYSGTGYYMEEIGDGMDHFYFCTVGPESGLHVYIDAIGLSSDQNYNIGDNVNEGLLLSYENSTVLDWTGYSLDGAANNTIQGNTTISLPEDGHHKIQVSGTSPGGIDYQSDIRHFTVKNGSISIITPENMTYRSPMSGYYPATYGFDDIGRKGTNIDFVDGTQQTCNLTLVNNIDSHNGVLQYNGTTTGSFYNEFGNNFTNGKVEFWIRVEDITDAITDLQLWEVGGSTLIQKFRIHSGEFQRQTGEFVFTTVQAVSADIWYHIRIDWFSDNTYDLYIDNIQKVTGVSLYNSMTIGCNRMRIYTFYDGNIFIDGWGNSWDPDYTMGDNLNEGLLLSYENSTALDWTGYSLDGAANITIQGNTTIPLPDDGTHTIQVSGTSPLGIDYQSDVRHFIVNRDKISIITPESTTYIEPMSGYYPATYGFEKYEDGVFPNEFIVVNDDGNGGRKVINEIDGHKNVIDLYDTVDPGYYMMYQYFTESHKSGTVELWMRTSDDTGWKRGEISVKNSDSNLKLLQVRLSNGNFYYVIGTTQYFIRSASANIWYHIRIDFECSNQRYKGLPQYTWQVYIDNVKYGLYSFVENENEAGYLGINTGSFDYGYHYYIDAIGYSWDPNYQIGDNMNEGLLLSFENNTILDWTGYSLDGAANITIQGNTTIPMSTGNELHSIQVSGITSTGMTIQSDIRYFSLDWEYICLRPNLNVLDLINEFGLHLEIDLNSIGFLHVDKQSFTFPGLPHIGYNRSRSYFYSIDLYNPNFIKDTSILSSITIRFYYDPLEINDPEKLQLYHYISSIGQWRSEDIIINTVQNYVELTTSELSYFCLSEIVVPIIPIPWPIIIIIIILSTIGISIPSGYVFISRRKKKKEVQDRKIPTWGIEERILIKESISRISPEMITPIKPLESKISYKTEVPKKSPKKIKQKLEKITLQEQSLVKEDLEKIEKEIEIIKQEDICIIHKGPILGINYVCPSCKAKYCLKCASTLKMREEKCWICNSDIYLDIEQSTKLNIQEKKINLNNMIKSSNPIEEILKHGDLEMTAIPNEIKKKLDKLNLDDKELEEILKDLVAFNTQEQLKIIEGMFKIKNEKKLGKRS